MEAQVVNIVGEHLCCMQDAMNRSGIKKSTHVFSSNETGISFKNMVGCSILLYRKVAKTRRNLDQMTVMTVVNVADQNSTL